MFSFIGFDGKEYNLPDFPKEYKNFNHYLIVHRNDNCDYLFLFNENIKIERNNIKKNLTLSLDNGAGFKYYFYMSGSSYLEIGNGLSTSIFLSFDSEDDYVLTYSSRLFRDFCKDVSIMNGFSLDVKNLPKTELYLSVEPYKDKLPHDVFIEIFDILPVLIVCLVSFLAIRKGIKFLFNNLRFS